MVYTHLAAALVAGAIAFAGGWKVQQWRWDSAELARVERERESQRMRERAAAGASERFEQQRETVRVIYEAIDKGTREIVERPVYRNVCLDDDGLRQLNAAIERTGHPGEPQGPVPAAVPAERLDGG